MALRAVDEHPKLQRLTKLLNCGRFEAVGALECLWHFAGRYTPQGNVGKYEDDDIEGWLEWRGKRGAIVHALIEAGWLDRHPEHRLVVHDWHKHADDATKKALKRAGLRFLTEGAEPPRRDAKQPPVPQVSKVATSEPPPPPPRLEPTVAIATGANVIEIPVSEIGIEMWDECVAAAVKARMSFDPSPRSFECQKLWRYLNTAERIDAIRGINERVASGEYGAGQFVPTLENYLKKKMWKRPLRQMPPAKPAARANLRDELALLKLQEATLGTAISSA